MNSVCQTKEVSSDIGIILISFPALTRLFADSNKVFCGNFNVLTDKNCLED